MNGEMTRIEHVEWCKVRAREYLDAGNAQEAVASMASDYGKHPEHANSQQMVASLSMIALTDGTIGAARRFVEGFN